VKFLLLAHQNRLFALNIDVQLPVRFFTNSCSYPSNSARLTNLVLAVGDLARRSVES